MARYRNSSFKNSHSGLYGPEFYETDVTPTAYKGFEIYRRLTECFDCVVDGVCVSQRAGINGAKRFIDDFWERQNAA